jgi:hypothetical protein
VEAEAEEAAAVSREINALPLRAAAASNWPRCLLVAGWSSTLLVYWVRRLGRETGKVLRRKMRGSRAGRTARQIG